ncbi:MAG: hypothetical protein PHN68_06950 [Prolixibacteraceae bacterium]|nr:hypothetical protein [Prolixibacteraceae bacterium]
MLKKSFSEELLSLLFFFRDLLLMYRKKRSTIYTSKVLMNSGNFSGIKEMGPL